MQTAKRVLVIGAGAAGSAAAAALSHAAADLVVVVVGDEDRPPYNRTTVNKGLLSGAVTDDNIGLPGMDLPTVTWRLGERVVNLEATDRTARLASGEELAADAILLAVGADPRPLPVQVDARVAGRVVTLRTANDTTRLREVLTPGSPVLIVGAGVLGTETAGVLTEAGHPVQLIDAAETPMESLVGRTVASWILDAHRKAGVHVRVSTYVNDLSIADDTLTARFSDNTVATPQVVVAALGVAPATGWLTGTGVIDDATGAVVVDASQRVVGLQGIYAAGDIAAVPGPHGQPIRVEHWGAALSQGRAAARTILADLTLGAYDDPTPELPSYSTYVHGTKLTILGWPHLATGEVPLTGAPSDVRFAVALHDASSRLVGAVGVGGARSVNRLKPLIEQRAHVSYVLRSDPAA